VGQRPLTYAAAPNQALQPTLNSAAERGR